MVLIGKSGDAQSVCLRALGNRRPIHVHRDVGMPDLFERRIENSMSCTHLSAPLTFVPDAAVIAIDYGRVGDEREGSAQVRAGHRILDSPFEQIGHADITMHVDWSTIAERAQADGLRVAGFTDQHHFLTGILSELWRPGSPAFAWLRRGMPELPPGDWGQSPHLLRQR